ncbi:IS3 family transposase [Streptomyces sp. NPDC051098]|uniref:IS3 family transposase n=1 Tax=Streptomyces sp. NPDC051098 TaxID=3155411 RepID=UPI003417F185
MTVHPFIEAEKRDGHNVKRACELLQVSRTAFYARRTGKPGPRAVRDAELTGQITAVHAKSRGTYGAPRIHAVLKREGALCGRRRVARLMRAAGLEGRHRRRRRLTTFLDPRAASRPDLLVRDFAPDPDGLDTRWCGDITYVPTEEGWLYLATVIDIASRRVVGWATADHLRTELVADALTAACRQRRPTRPVIFHSDGGCQLGLNRSLNRPDTSVHSETPGPLSPGSRAVIRCLFAAICIRGVPGRGSAITAAGACWRAGLAWGPFGQARQVWARCERRWPTPSPCRNRGWSPVWPRACRAGRS